MIPDVRGLKQSARSSPLTSAARATCLDNGREKSYAMGGAGLDLWLPTITFPGIRLLRCRPQRASAGSPFDGLIKAERLTADRCRLAIPICLASYGQAS